MKKILFTIITVGILLPQLVYAQTNPDPILEQTVDETTESDVQNPFTIKLEVGTQSPWTKNVPINVVFTPSVDSSRTEISWDAPLGVVVEKNYDDYFQALKGQVYSREAQISVTQPGTYTIVANVTNWGYGSNVTSSEEVTLTFGEDHLVTPPTPGYRNAVIIKYTILLAVFLVIVIFLVFATKKALKFLKKWLQPPQ